LVGPFRGRDGQNAATSPWPSCGHGVPLWGALLRWDWVPREGLGRTLGLSGSPRSCCQAGPRRGSARRRSSTSPGFCCCGRLPFSKEKKSEEGTRRRLVKQGRLWRCRSGHRPVLVAGEAGALLPLSLS